MKASYGLLKHKLHKNGSKDGEKHFVFHFPTFIQQALSIYCLEVSTLEKKSHMKQYENNENANETIYCSMQLNDVNAIHALAVPPSICLIFFSLSSFTLFSISIWYSCAFIAMLCISSGNFRAERKVNRRSVKRLKLKGNEIEKRNDYWAVYWLFLN